jgi:hypothetical protein
MTYKCSNGSSKTKTTQPHEQYYSEWLMESRNKQSKAFVSEVTASEKAPEASYLVAELNAQKRRKGGESLTMPACKIIEWLKCCNKMQDKNLKMFHQQ